MGAVANGPTSVTVSWSASSDASGIANYEVYRGGVLLTTVSGSTTVLHRHDRVGGHAVLLHGGCDRCESCQQQVSPILTTGYGDHAGGGFHAAECAAGCGGGGEWADVGDGVVVGVE